MPETRQLYQTPRPQGLPLCPICQLLAGAAAKPQVVDHPQIGVLAHYFVIQALPVEGEPTRADLMNLCESYALRLVLRVPSTAVLEALSKLDPERATQGKADVASDILASL